MKTAIQKQRELAHPPLVLGLAEAVGRLREKEEWHSAGRAGLTLVKTPGRCVTLMTLRKGTVLARHCTRYALFIQVLSGKIRVGTDSQHVEADAHSLVTLDPKVPHEVEAIEESELLLFVVKEVENERPESCDRECLNITEP